MRPTYIHDGQLVRYSISSAWRTEWAKIRDANAQLINYRSTPQMLIIFGWHCKSALILRFLSQCMYAKRSSVRDIFLPDLDGKRGEAPTAFIGKTLNFCPATS